MPRQRHDLRLQPGIKNEFGEYIPTPLFVPSAEGRFGPPEPPPFGQLLWSPPNRKGEQTEVCARSPKEVNDYIEMGYETKPLPGHAPDPMEILQAQFEALSEEDKAFLLKARAEDKKAKMREMLASLTEDEVSQLTGQVAKRGPGRPRKAIA